MYVTIVYCKVTRWYMPLQEEEVRECNDTINELKGQVCVYIYICMYMNICSYIMYVQVCICMWNVLFLLLFISIHIKTL